MTEKEVIDTIERVADRYAHKFQFGFYTAEDIKQEAFMLGMEALDRYDPSRPLENFLAVHISNRLKTFKRDNYYRKDGSEDMEITNRKELKKSLRNESRKNLMHPIDIDSVRQEGEKNMIFVSNESDIMANKEIIRIIDMHLDISCRKDYLRMIDGVYVSKARREEVKSEIVRILGENGIEERPF
tara:strand:+ start:306 stop:860 length:555 start_codon:yes stop_codon:yes gene_type:complete